MTTKAAPVYNPHHFENEVNARRRELIREALEECGGNITRAADYLGLHRNSVAKWMQVLRITACAQHRELRPCYKCGEPLEARQ